MYLYTVDVRLLFIGENSHSTFTTFDTRHRYNVIRNGEFRTCFGGLIDYVRKHVI